MKNVPTIWRQIGFYKFTVHIKKKYFGFLTLIRPSIILSQLPSSLLVKNLMSKNRKVKEYVGFKYEPVVDEFKEDSAVIFETERLKKGRRESVPQEMLVRHHRVRHQVWVVDHCNWENTTHIYQRDYKLSYLPLYWQCNLFVVTGIFLTLIYKPKALPVFQCSK